MSSLFFNGSCINKMVREIQEKKEKYCQSSWASTIITAVSVLVDISFYAHRIIMFVNGIFYFNIRAIGSVAILKSTNRVQQYPI